MKNGSYIGRAETYDFGYSDKGSEFVAVSFKIEEGESAGERITWKGYFSEKTQARTLESLRYCGWEGHVITDLQGLTNNLVQLVIENEEYNGKTYAKVQWVNKLGGAAIKNRMDDKARASFAARMKGAALAVSKDLAQGPRTKEAIAPHGDEYEPPQSDDMPF